MGHDNSLFSACSVRDDGYIAAGAYLPTQNEAKIRPGRSPPVASPGCADRRRGLRPAVPRRGWQGAGTGAPGGGRQRIQQAGFAGVGRPGQRTLNRRTAVARGGRIAQGGGK